MDMVVTVSLPCHLYNVCPRGTCRPVPDDYMVCKTVGKRKILKPRARPSALVTLIQQQELLRIIHFMPELHLAGRHRNVSSATRVRLPDLQIRPSTSYVHLNIEKSMSTVCVGV